MAVSFRHETVCLLVYPPLAPNRERGVTAFCLYVSCIRTEGESYTSQILHLQYLSIFIILRPNELVFIALFFYIEHS